MKKLELLNVTLVALTSTNIWESVQALKYSMKEIKFGEVLLITHKKPWYLPSYVQYRYIPKMYDIDCYNKSVLYDLSEYISTDFVLIVHRDGFVVNPKKWKEEFLDYDYIGAPWPQDECFKDIHGQIQRVGNGVSLRSKKLLEFPEKYGLSWKRYEEGPNNEDVFLCCTNRHILEEEGIKIAPIEVAKYFSHEYMIPEIEGIEPFMFHQWNGSNNQYPKFRNIPLRLWNKITREE